MLRGDYGEIFVGARTSVQDGTSIRPNAIPAGVQDAAAFVDNGRRYRDELRRIG